MFNVRLLSIKCIVNDEIDKDEIYLKYKGKKIWPKNIYFQIDNGEEQEIDFLLEHQGQVLELELWDHDMLSPNDHLGTFVMNVAAQGGKYATDLNLTEKDSTASYTLTWEVY